MKKLFLIFVSLILYQISSFAQLEFWKDNQQFQKSFELPTEALNTNIDSLMLDSIISAYRNSQSVPGIATLITKDSQVIWNKNYGYRNLELQLPVGDSTLFLIGSISKTILVTAVMQLWENGLIELEGNINNYLPPGITVVHPYFPSNTITVKMLMTHTASIQDNWDILDYLWTCGDYPVTYDSFLVNYFTPGGAYYSLNNFYTYRPGQNRNYSNTGSCLLALMVEHLSGKSFEEYTRDSIFIPLSMNATSWFLQGFDTSKIATPYMYQPPAPMCQTGMAYWPIGQLRTNKIELSNFLSTYISRGIYNNFKLLDSSTISFMFSDQGFSTQFGGRQGLIWCTDPEISNRAWGHGGLWYGAYAMMFCEPLEKWGIIFFINWATPPNFTENRPLTQMAHFAHLYGNIYSLNPSIDKSYAKVNVDSILFRTRFSNIYNHQFTPHLIYVNTTLTEKDSLTLYDDGNHGDLLAGDGLYAGYIPPRTIEDYYTLSVSTFDNQTNKYFNTPDQCRFTTIPLIFNHLQYSAISNFRYTFKPYLKNAGTVHTIKNVIVKLSCGDPWVTAIFPAKTSCANLLPGQITGIASAFAVTYDSTSFPGYFNLKFSISSADFSSWVIDTTIVVKPTDVEDDLSLPSAYTLEQNYPNPFNPITTIGFGIPEKGDVRLSVLNLLGEEIRVLLNEEKEAGYHSVDFDASELPSGVYFYQLNAGEFMSTKKMILLR